MMSLNAAAAAQHRPSLFRNYQAPAVGYDELLSSTGALRPGWREFAELITSLGVEELERRWQQARRLIRENGLAYNVHGDPHGRDRRWELDALPLVVDHADWAQLAAGLAQRARLLDALLRDLYGPQRLLVEGLLPAELILAHPGFLRPCHGWRVPGERYLHLYAAHVVRTGDGAWTVVADRTQAPVGAGYAVENRIVISRMMPHIFHHCQVERLAGFFLSLRGALRELALPERPNPQIVLLSAGPASPTYFEDSYLARYLGYTLVEGEDLTVRDARVFLKTLGGLVNVDVIFRRVPDGDCDPLELGGDSRLGVPGLTHAARRGNVVLANALGSGLLETPALMAFLPGLCRRLLDEDLLLSSARTWWCGQRESLAHVREHLPSLLVSAAVPGERFQPVHGGSLTREALAELRQMIEAQPRKFIAQEMLPRSTTPVWKEGTLAPGQVALRAFAVAAGDSYRVMPGGLAHVAPSGTGGAEARFVGHGSKDVWILADGPVAPLTLLQPPGSPVTLRRSGNDLPSRVADNLFWLGRNVERTEACVRLLRSILTRLINEPDPRANSEVTALYRALTLGVDSPGDPTRAGEASLERQVLAFLLDHARPGSLQSLLKSLARVATAVRDRLSLDSWRILQRTHEDFYPAYRLEVVSLVDVLALLDQMVLNLAAFSGVATENMTRGPGWQFLDLGRRIERALNLISLLRSTLFVPGGNEHSLLEALLEIADSSMTYRGRYAATLQAPPLVDLLLTDETNPRSIAYQLVALAALVERLPRQQSEPLLSAEQRLAMAVLSSIRLADVQRLGEVDGQGLRSELDRLLHEAAEGLCSLANSISLKYLVHSGPAHQLAGSSRK